MDIEFGYGYVILCVASLKFLFRLELLSFCYFNIKKKQASLCPAQTGHTSQPAVHQPPIWHGQGHAEILQDVLGDMELCVHRAICQVDKSIA